MGDGRKKSLFDTLLETKKPIFLDGGLATELERRGCSLNHRLWSAKVMLEDPEAIKAVHLAYLDAGADIIATATYQASYPGLISEGMSDREATRLLTDTVDTACEARREFISDEPGFLKDNSSSIPLVAASIGPYGAYLADGSEYTGEYKVSRDELYDFHARRFATLAQTDADLMACETIPNFEEAKVLFKIIENTPKPAIMSFSCRDEAHISDGTPLAECAAMISKSKRLFAIGINCTPPSYVSGLIKQVRTAAPGKQIAVYPNSGETYDAQTKTWQGISSSDEFAELSRQWFHDGARLIGGCCRTGPGHIRAIRDALKASF